MVPEEKGFKDYKRMLELLETHSKVLYPWWTMWPKYETQEEYRKDLESYDQEVWLTTNQLKELKEWVSTEIPKIIELESENSRSFNDLSHEIV